MGFITKFFKDVLFFFTNIKNEFFQLQYPDINQTTIYVVGVVVMLLFFCFFFFILDFVFGFCLTKFFSFFV
ncbi:preprotein translocase subunit SecE [Alphaproteobacteria bacterium endosymbiont of Tiliacea citrago]|uniref:preprotein translocase subunit SecE n=1 Tax=Alphaproteobacteria bacterium endosymbiont of Tiliacea citrago TaxID=3077944 RepID=UPI003CC7ACC2